MVKKLVFYHGVYRLAWMVVLSSGLEERDGFWLLESRSWILCLKRQGRFLDCCMFSVADGSERKRRGRIEAAAREKPRKG